MIDDDAMVDYERETPIDVDEVMATIGVRVHPEIAAFYARYEGPFESPATGVELLALLGESSVLSNTLICRTEHHFPRDAIVLSELLGNAVYVADASTGAVYNVDFEGSDRAFVAGTLEPEHSTFSQFIAWYFGGE
jgi:hypothetical protein